jgi:hypothetical protein
MATYQSLEACPQVHGPDRATLLGELGHASLYRRLSSGIRS